MNFYKFSLEDDKNYPEVISGQDLYLMLFSSFKCLEKYNELLDSINVFPVPDGDTGTNLVETFKSIINELSQVHPNDSCGTIISLASQGAFKGCAGSSGSILSEYFRGLEVAWNDQQSLNIAILVEGLNLAAKFAYNAVVKPKEGTILTVARSIGESALVWMKLVTNPFELLHIIFEDAKIALKDTHYVLKEAHKAGVVDSGAMGLVVILEGFLIKIKEIYQVGFEIIPIKDELNYFIKSELDFEEIEKKYEIIALIQELECPLSTLKSELDDLGDSLVITKADNESKIKIHIHCNNPTEVIAKLNSLTNMVTILSLQSLQQQNIEFLKKKNQRIGRISN